MPKGALMSGFEKPMMMKKIVALDTDSEQREFFHAPRDVGEVEVACVFAVGQIASGVYYGLTCDIANPIGAMLPVTDLWLPDYKADDDALHVKFTGVSNKVIRENLKRLVAAKAKMDVRCLVVPNCTDGADLAARHAYLNSIGVPESSIVNLEYFDYARSKYLALGLPDTMPPKGT